MSFGFWIKRHFTQKRFQLNSDSFGNVCLFVCLWFKENNFTQFKKINYNQYGKTNHRESCDTVLCPYNDKTQLKVRNVEMQIIFVDNNIICFFDVTLYFKAIYT